MKTYMPLNGLRWSRNSGSANCDMPQSAVFGRPGGAFSRFFRRREQSEEVISIRRHLSEIGQYYIEYRDLDDLKTHITQDFRRYGL